MHFEVTEMSENQLEYCTRCGAKNEGYAYCPKCGQPLTSATEGKWLSGGVCPRCGDTDIQREEAVLQGPSGIWSTKSNAVMTFICGSCGLMEMNFKEKYGGWAHLWDGSSAERT